MNSMLNLRYPRGTRFPSREEVNGRLPGWKRIVELLVIALMLLASYGTISNMLAQDIWEIAATVALEWVFFLLFLRLSFGLLQAPAGGLQLAVTLLLSTAFLDLEVQTYGWASRSGLASWLAASIVLMLLIGFVLFLRFIVWNEGFRE